VSTQADSTLSDVDLSAEITAVPHHLGIIMDGNGRWAQARGLPRLAGHRAGVDNIRRILEHCVQRGVKVLTIYAFSTENWQRPPDEVSGLMRLLGLTIQRQLNDLDRNGVTMKDSDRRTKEREIESLNRDFQRRNREFREDQNMRSGQEMASIQERANKVIQQIADAEKFDLILQEAVFVSPRIDITDKVLKSLADK